MYCGQCGTEIPPQAKFCGGCGSPVSGSPRTSVSETLDRLRGNSNTNRFGTSLSRTAAANNDVQPEEDVRCLFVVGAAQTDESINWLKSKYPKSYIAKFSTIGAVRERVFRHVNADEIDHLCLIGSAATVPPHKIGINNAHSESASGQVEFFELESDIFYCSESLNVSTVPDFREDSKRSLFYRQSIQRTVADDLIGIVPVGRIPFDNFIEWKDYLLGIESTNFPEQGEWVSIASQENRDWGKECEAVLQSLNQSGRFYVVPHDWEQLLTDLSSQGFKPGTRIQVNLHGGKPPKNDPLGKQYFVSLVPPGSSTGFDLSETQPYPQSIMFLYACYGGNSGWWNSGFMPEFFKGGGCALIASSTSVWCSSHFEEYAPNLPPGAVEICAEFYRSIDTGLSLGDALTVAKAKTLSNSLEIAGGIDFCKTLKEVCQFSLFGAPWFAPSGKASSVVKKTEPKSTSSILDSIRSGGRISRNLASASGVLSQVRERLHRSLGSGAEYFTLSRQSVIEAYRSTGALENISNSVRSAGFEFESSSFESLVVNGKEFQIAISPSNNKDSSDQLMVVIDEEGQILKTFQTKG